MNRSTLRFALVAATTFATVLAQPQSQPQQGPDEDGPGRGVARVSLMYGDVSVRRADTNEWSAAVVNQPLMAEDRLLTGIGARTEVQFDSSNFLRLGTDTEVRMGNLEQRSFLMMLSRGTITYRILRDMDADVEIATPSIAVRPTKKGIYRIAVAADGSTEVTVRSGEADIFTPRGSQRLNSGRTLLARGDMNDPEFQFISAIPKDEWDHWNEKRDQGLSSSRSYDYVSRDIYGAEDLDANGRWVSTPDYGTVWSPAAGPGWAPYRNGRWVWADYYGWTWVSYDSWGWAPYHYGRWFNSPMYGWCWYPGGVNTRHYYRPALVAFFGLGRGGVGIGFGGGFGHVGWVPLAPHEPFYPWYGSRHYNGYRNGGTVNNVNITNVNITNVYRNSRVDGGVTSVQAGNFGRGTVNNVRMNRDDLNQAGLVRGQVQIAPDRASTRYSDSPNRVASNSSRDDQRFYSRSQPSRIDRIPFDQQREHLSRATGGGDVTAVTTGRTAPRNEGVGRGGAVDAGNGSWRRAGESNNAPAQAPAVRGTDPVASPRQNSGDGGWRRFGDPGSAPAPAPAADRNAGRSQQSNQPADTSRGGWGRFGDPAAPANRQPDVQTRPDSRSDRNGSRTGSTDTARPYVAPSVEPSTGNSGRGNNDQGGRMERRQQQESPRMSQPVVTERAAPQRYESRPQAPPQAAPQRNESRQPAPQQAPQQAAPSRPEPRSEPRSGGSESRGGGGRTESRSGNKNR